MEWLMEKLSSQLERSHAREDVCRACLKSGSVTVSIFQDKWDTMFHYTTGIKVSLYDRLPHQLCAKCSSLISKFYKFKKSCVSVDTSLRQKTFSVLDEDEEVFIKQEESDDDVYFDDNKSIEDNDVHIEYITVKKNSSCKISHESKDKKLLKQDNPKSSEDKDNVKGSKACLQLSADNNECKQLKRKTVGSKTKLQESKPKELIIEETELSITDDHQCGLCKNTFKTFPNLCAHIETHKDDETCQYEDCSFPNAEWTAFVIHRFEHMASESRLVYRCHMCLSPQSVRSVVDLGVHMRTKHFSPGGNDDSSEAQCSVCLKWLKSKENLRHHTKYMHGDHVYLECASCPYKSHDKASLRTHIKNKHGPRPDRVTCKICRKRFNSDHQLRYHKYKEHKPTRCVCHICGKSLDGATSGYKTHMESHSGKVYKCHICLCVLGSEKALKLHVRRHLNGRKFKCPQCPSSYYNNSSLVHHMRTHAGVRVKCPICDLTLASVSIAGTHCRKMHKVAWKEALKGKSVEFVHLDKVVNGKCERKKRKGKTEKSME